MQAVHRPLTQGVRGRVYSRFFQLRDLKVTEDCSRAAPGPYCIPLCVNAGWYIRELRKVSSLTYT